MLQVLCVWHAVRLLSTSKPSWLGKTSTHRWALGVLTFTAAVRFSRQQSLEPCCGAGWGMS